MPIEIVDEAETADAEKSGKELRKSQRHTYHCRQLVAPYDGSRLPQQEEFDWAMFRDISPTGISFLTSNKPTTKQLIVAVGPAPFSFLIVEIVRSSRREDLENRPYLVGCRIVGELDDEKS